MPSGTSVVAIVKDTCAVLSPPTALSTIVFVLLLSEILSYVPSTCLSSAVLVVGNCLDVPGHIIRTVPGPPFCPAPKLGLPIREVPPPPPP